MAVVCPSVENPCGRHHDNLASTAQESYPCLGNTNRVAGPTPTWPRLSPKFNSYPGLPSFQLGVSGIYDEGVQHVFARRLPPCVKGWSPVTSSLFSQD
jgi:hypothetical protein